MYHCESTEYGKVLSDYLNVLIFTYLSLSQKSPFCGINKSMIGKNNNNKRERGERTEGRSGREGKMGRRRFY